MHAKRLVDGVQGWVRIAVVFALLGLIVGGYQATRAQQTGADPDAKQPAGKCAKAEEFKEVPGVGPACKLPNGHWRVRLKDGSHTETHGPDPESISSSAPVESTAAATSSHVCVSDLTNGYYGLIIYAYPSNQSNRASTYVPVARSNFQAAQDLLNSESMTFGVSASYKMACNADGSVRIDTVQLPTPMGSTSFSTVVSDLKAKGYTNPRAKYWVWFDGRPSGAGCGIGSIYGDDSASASNLNNGNVSSGLFGVNWGPNCNAMMHENGHNMGAVQQSAPNTSGPGDWHCIDGNDVMCYKDAGQRAYLYSSTVCTDRKHFDCNQNDYFHPAPAAGSYLATHWNIGACYNRFIQRSGCGTTSPTATRTSTGISTTAWYAVINQNSGKCLDDANWGTANGAILQQWACAYSNNQQWQFQPTDSGYYRILSRHAPSLVIDVSGPSTANGAKVHLWSYVGGSNQQWKPEAMGSGVYRFRARHSNRCLDVPSASTADGVQLQQYDCNGTAAQSFRLAQQA